MNCSLHHYSTPIIGHLLGFQKINSRVHGHLIRNLISYNLFIWTCTFRQSKVIFWRSFSLFPKQDVFLQLLWWFAQRFPSWNFVITDLRVLAEEKDTKPLGSTPTRPQGSSLSFCTVAQAIKANKLSSMTALRVHYCSWVNSGLNICTIN